VNIFTAFVNIFAGLSDTFARPGNVLTAPVNKFGGLDNKPSQKVAEAEYIRGAYQ
jgi:hypothetical protein